MNAIRIDPSSAKLPRPSNKLFEDMADAGQDAAAQFIEDASGKADGGTVQPGVMLDAMWETVSRAMYAVLAKRGGGKVTRLKGGTE